MSTQPLGWYKRVDKFPKDEQWNIKLRRIAACCCGREYPFLSQDNLDGCEYTTHITLECECGKMICMTFPVN